jgi:hypothetical protein
LLAKCSPAGTWDVFLEDTLDTRWGLMLPRLIPTTYTLAQ